MGTAAAPNLGVDLSSHPTDAVFLDAMIIRVDGRVELETTIAVNISTSRDMSSLFEMQGRIRLIASDGVSVDIIFTNADTTAPYAFIASNPTGINSFRTHVNGLTDKEVTAIFNDLANQPPVVTVQASSQTVNGNGTIALTGTASDPDEVPDTLAVQWTANPDIGTFSDDDALTTNWTAPAPTDADQQVVLTMTATEPDENLTGSASVTVTIRANQGPTVTVGQDHTTVDIGDIVNLTGSAVDPEGQALNYSWTSDSGGTFGTPTLANTTWEAPTVGESLPVSLTLTATDPNGAQGMAAATVIVRAATIMPLALPAVADQSTATGVTVNFTLPEATDGLQPYVYSATGLPVGLRFRNRRIEGIPVLPGTSTISYVVTDSNQDMATRTFDYVITGNPIPQPSGINLRIDWGDQFYSSQLSDVTNRITSGISFERGKNTASAILGRSQAGELRCELDDADGRFDEENAGSPLAGLIRPGIQVQLRNGVTPLWTGVLDSLPTRLMQNGQHRSELTARGVLSNTLDADVSGGSLTAESTAQAFIELLGKGEVPSESPQPMPGDAYVMRRWWLTGKLKEALNVLEDTEGGFIFEDREGEVGFHLANYRGAQTVNRTFVSSPPSTDQLRIVGQPRTQLAVKDVHNEVRDKSGNSIRRLARRYSPAWTRSRSL